MENLAPGRARVGPELGEWREGGHVSTRLARTRRLLEPEGVVLVIRTIGHCFDKKCTHLRSLLKNVFSFKFWDSSTGIRLFMNGIQQALDNQIYKFQ